MTGDLVGFLLARIAEDEAVAQQVRRNEHLRSRDDSDLSSADVGGYDTVAITSGRVLAECDAKRQIVRLVGTLGGHYEPDAGRIAPQILRQLALPYADHPDYQQEWKP